MSDGVNTWRVEFDSGIPVYKQIFNRISSGLASGHFKAGDRLPTIRELQQQLGVNPNTVAKAYRELELKGVIVCERGNGSYINPDATLAPPNGQDQQAKLESFYQRVLSEAAGCGISENELIQYIKERSRP